MKTILLFILLVNFSMAQVQIGQDIDGEAAGDRSGGSVSLSSDGTIMAIGAIGNDDSAGSSGHVRIYENQSGTWVQIGQDIDGEGAGDSSGGSVSLSSDGTVVAIGAAGNNSLSGHVRVYENQSGTWVQIGQDIDGEGAGDSSGRSVSLSSDGTIMAIGAPGNNGNGTFSGHVRVYENQSGTWVQIGQDIDGEASGDLLLGGSVSLSPDGTVVAIGAASNDGNGTDSGHVRVYDLSSKLSSDEFVLSQFSLSPNPANNQFAIHLGEGLQLRNINLYNNLGQFILSTNDTTVNTSSLNSGVYFVEIETNQGKATKRLIIE